MVGPAEGKLLGRWGCLWCSCQSLGWHLWEFRRHCYSNCRTITSQGKIYGNSDAVCCLRSICRWTVHRHQNRFATSALFPRIDRGSRLSASSCHRPSTLPPQACDLFRTRIGTTCTSELSVSLSKYDANCHARSPSLCFVCRLMARHEGHPTHPPPGGPSDTGAVSAEVDPIKPL